MRQAANRGFINATDCADYLTKKGMPFRDAYTTVGKLVYYCTQQGKTLEQLSLAELQDLSPLFGEDVYTGAGSARPAWSSARATAARPFRRRPARSRPSRPLLRRRIMKPIVYIDGKEGTTGLQIYDRIGARDDIDPAAH